MTAGATVGDSGQEADAEKHPVVLTAHPLQRAGAFALAAIAGAPDPERIGEQEFREAASAMEQALQATAGIASSGETGGFWLGVSQLLWPNAKALAHPRRKGLSVEDRRAWIRSWRTVPGPGRSLGVPCALCGRPAAGYHGKVDVPLGASVEYRNTTARGQEGTPLCRGCLVSFYALPYACAIAKGRPAVLLYSWDDEFLRGWVTSQVRRMRRRADVAAGRFGADRPYAQQVAALYEIREYGEAVSAGVELLVFSNSNRKQRLVQHVMDQPLTSWLRRVRYDPKSADGWRYLVRAHAQPDDRGELEDDFDQLFNGTEVILAEDADEYRRLLNENTPATGRLLAADLVIPVRPWAAKAGRWNKELSIAVIDGDYDPVLGLLAARSYGGSRTYSRGDVL